jgi:hypothetical protein
MRYVRQIATAPRAPWTHAPINTDARPQPCGTQATSPDLSVGHMRAVGCPTTATGTQLRSGGSELGLQAKRARQE